MQMIIYACTISYSAGPLNLKSTCTFLISLGSFPSDFSCFVYCVAFLSGLSFLFLFFEAGACGSSGYYCLPQNFT